MPDEELPEVSIKKAMGDRQMITSLFLLVVATQHGAIVVFVDG